MKQSDNLETNAPAVRIGLIISRLVLFIIRTRSIQHRLKRQLTRNTASHHFLPNRTVPTWNKQPLLVRTAKSVIEFKNQYDKFIAMNLL